MTPENIARHAERALWHFNECRFIEKNPEVVKRNKIPRRMWHDLGSKYWHDEYIFWHKKAIECLTGQKFKPWKPESKNDDD